MPIRFVVAAVVALWTLLPALGWLAAPAHALSLDPAAVHAPGPGGTDSGTVHKVLGGGSSYCPPISDHEASKYFRSAVRALAITQGASVVLFFALAFLLGLGVAKRTWRVNYTRKIFGLAMFIAPFPLMFWAIGAAPFHNHSCKYPPHVSGIDAAFGFWSYLLVPAVVFLGCMLMFSQPFVTRSAFLATCFRAIDRPEDRPHTLSWFVTSHIATMLVLVIGILAFSALPYQIYFDVSFAFVLGIIVSNIGDVLAEPVGIRFGTQHYATKALFSSHQYVRTYAGSLCVFGSAMVAVALFAFIRKIPLPLTSTAIAIVPPIMTLAEAKSPHTWDQPVIFAAAFLSTFALALVAAVLGYQHLF